MRKAKLNLILISICLLINTTSCSIDEGIKQSQSPDILDVSSNKQESKTEADNVITLAATSASIGSYIDILEEFNEENNGYTIELKLYDEFYDSSKDTEFGSTLESFTGIDNQIVLDVIKGEGADIITDLSFTDKGKYNELVKKGAFIDLYPFLDVDHEINNDSLFNNILKLNESNGKLMTIPLFFYVDTLYGEAQYVGEKENWTFDEMTYYWEAMPENSTFNGKLTRDSVYRDILAPKLASFVDIENGVSNYDSPLFLEMLYFIMSFPNPKTYKTEPDYTNPNFVSRVNIKTFSKYHDLFIDDFGQQLECTFVGYPSEDMCGAYVCPNGRIGISANTTSEKQKGAWLFLKKLLEYDYQYEWGKYCFPVNVDAFAELGKDEYSKSNDNYAYTVQGQERTGTYLSYDEYCRLLEYINHIKMMDTDIDYSITSIINDEIMAMIWDENSPEKTAEAIQGRVEILVSEKY